MAIVENVGRTTGSGRQITVVTKFMTIGSRVFSSKNMGRTLGRRLGRNLGRNLSAFTRVNFSFQVTTGYLKLEILKLKLTKKIKGETISSVQTI